MNIATLIDYINKERGTNLSAGYYQHIQDWMCWWRGFYKPFHEFVETAADGKKLKRKLYTLKMGKKVCEDWAAILLNDKTRITIDDAASSVFVQGPDDEEGTGGVFGANDFWRRGNELVEKAFASGTGAVVLRINDMRLSGGAVVSDPGAKIGMEFLPAACIVPITVRNDRIIDVAFASEVLDRGDTYIYLETHALDGEEYVITNRYFKESKVGLTEEPLPPGVSNTIRTGSTIPMFAIVAPNIVNNVDESTALGISVFANAMDNLAGVDLAFNNFCRDFKLGGKKVFVNKELTRTDMDGNTITPDDVAQQLFTVTGDDFIDRNGANKMIQEFNPALRVAENKDGVQSQLDYLSFKVGLGTKHYQFNGTSIVTATQYNGDKQELIQNAAKHYIAIEAFLKALVRAILYAGKQFCGQPVNPNAKVSVQFEDSYIIDKESERQRDLQEVRDGLMMDWEYRVKWRGETEDKAKKILSEKKTNDEWMGFKGE